MPRALSSYRKNSLMDAGGGNKLLWRDASPLDTRWSFITERLGVKLLLCWRGSGVWLGRDEHLGLSAWNNAPPPDLDRNKSCATGTPKMCLWWLKLGFNFTIKPILLFALLHFEYVPFPDSCERSFTAQFHQQRCPTANTLQTFVWIQRKTPSQCRLQRGHSLRRYSDES